MLGEILRMWLKKLKIAVIQKDIKSLAVLLDDIPVLKDAKEVEEALYLLQEAQRVVQALKDETTSSMLQMKKNIDFLNSTIANKTAQFDITL